MKKKVVRAHYFFSMTQKDPHYKDEILILYWVRYIAFFCSCSCFVLFLLFNLYAAQYTL